MPSLFPSFDAVLEYATIQVDTQDVVTSLDLMRQFGCTMAQADTWIDSLCQHPGWQAEQAATKVESDVSSSPTAPMTTCRSCGAPIVWGLTKNGKPCPFNVKTGIPTTESHFATCPDAKDWSTKPVRVQP